MENILIRLDGLSGNAAPLSDGLTSGLGVIVRSKDSHLLDLAQVQAVLAGPPSATCTHPRSARGPALSLIVLPSRSRLLGRWYA